MSRVFLQSETLRLSVTGLMSFLLAPQRAPHSEEVSAGGGAGAGGAGRRPGSSSAQGLQRSQVPYAKTARSHGIPNIHVHFISIIK